MNKITLCMIVKNEESNLDRCLKNIAGYMDEIVIVDTGSTDKTKEIALKYTDKVYEFTWIDDFAAARNYSISKSSNDNILIIDSDELTENIDIREIKRLINENPDKIGRLLRMNQFTRNGTVYRYSERVNRLFSRKYYQYEGIIHEQLVAYINEAENNKTEISITRNQIDIDSKVSVQYEKDKLNMSSVKDTDENAFKTTIMNKYDNTYQIPLTVMHSGYEGELEARRKKTNRNINLLKIAQQQNPYDPYLLYQLGKSYYMEEDYINASEYFGQALYYDLNPCLEYVQDMVESYGYSLINSGQYDTAMQMLNIYEEFANSADFIFMIALILMNNGKFQQAIEEFKKATEKRDAKMEGVNGFLAFYNIGVIYECLGNIENARKYYEKCGDYEAAKQRLGI